MEQVKVSLINLGGGAAIEKFDDELQKVIQNILDPNTTLRPRKVVLEVTLTPNETREISVTDIECTAKLAKVKPFKTTLFIGEDEEGATAVEAKNPNQGALAGYSATGSNKLVYHKKEKGV